MPEDFLATLARYAQVRVCSTRLGPSYPADCPYNIAFTGTHALCRSDILPPEISSFFSAAGITVVHTKQGYARCSTMIVDAQTVITQDEGVARAARSAGLDALLASDGAIPLKGFNRGFLGGCEGISVGGREFQGVHAAEKCADTDADTVFLTGSLTGHPDWKIIEAKIMSRGKKVVALSGEKAEDFGSILFL
jgi:hypothetical protein